FALPDRPLLGTCDVWQRLPMRRWLLLPMVLAGLTWPSLAIAQAGNQQVYPTPDSEDHLWPEGSALSDPGPLLNYEVVVTTVLKDAYDQDVQLRAIVLTNFPPEDAV